MWQGSSSEMNATLVDDEVARDMYATDPDRAAGSGGLDQALVASKPRRFA
jgi:hypothetical protein